MTGTSSKIKRALISVFDKENILDLAKFLISENVEIISSGGTARFLNDNNCPVTEITSITNFPEILGGRVKTLHPKVHGGILSRRSEAMDIQECQDNNITPIDLVIVNLYPFENDPSIEMIDIGGPTLLRAAAKNYKYVSVLHSPKQYHPFIDYYKSGTLTIEKRKEWAQQVFSYTSYYDNEISNWLSPDKSFPKTYTLKGQLKNILRYGENPHQKAALYSTSNDDCTITQAKQLNGKELSYNNILDSDSAYNLASEFDDTVCVIVKHNNPCGVSTGTDTKSAYLKALSCDPKSAFGGIVCFNREIDEKTAVELKNFFLEVIIAPSYSAESLNILRSKKNLRLLQISFQNQKTISTEVRKIGGGFLVQSSPKDLSDINYRTVTKRAPSNQEFTDIIFANRVCKHVKSNAIILASDAQTVGIGAGQMSRVDSCHIASLKMEEMNLKEKPSPLILASDAFFPFSDTVSLAAKHNVTAIVQPGGSIRDEEVIEEANKHDIAMVFSETRYFKH